MSREESVIASERSLAGEAPEALAWELCSTNRDDDMPRGLETIVHMY